MDTGKAGRVVAPLATREQGIRYTATAAIVDPRVTFERWCELAATAVAMERSSRFWLGDVLRAGKELFGEEFSAILDRLDLSERTGQIALLVAERWPPKSRRDKGVTWSHHAELASLPTLEEREQWIDRAVKEQWTSGELRMKVRETRALASPTATESIDSWECGGCGLKLADIRKKAIAESGR